MSEEAVIWFAGYDGNFYLKLINGYIELSVLKGSDDKWSVWFWGSDFGEGVGDYDTAEEARSAAPALIRQKYIEELGQELARLTNEVAFDTDDLEDLE